MLVLSRKIGERIIIGDNIVITVVRVENGKVRLGIEAPRDVHVIRPEALTKTRKDDTPVPTMSE